MSEPKPQGKRGCSGCGGSGFQTVIREGAKVKIRCFCVKKPLITKG